MIKYLKDQHGQFWGAFGQAFTKAYQEAPDVANRRAESALKQKMLQLQIDKIQQANLEETQRNTALEQLGQLITQGVEEPQQLQVATPAQAQDLAPSNIALPQGAAVSPEGLTQMPPPQQIPETTRRPATNEEKVAAALKTSAKNEIAQQYIKSLFPTASSSSAANAAYATLQDAMAVKGTPDWQSAFPQGARLKQTSKGWQWESLTPVNFGASVAHTASQTWLQSHPGDFQGAAQAGAQAMQNYNFATQQAQAQGNVAGGVAAKTETPVQPMQPMEQPTQVIPQNPQAATTATPSTVTPNAVTPTPPPGPKSNYPTSPSTGTGPASSRYMQTKQQEAAATKQGSEQVAAQKSLLGMSGLKAIVDRLDVLSTQIPAGAPGIGRFGQGAINWLQGEMQTDPNIAEFESKRKAYANILNRSLLAEKGVITDRDREYAVGAIPSIWDTAQVRALKMAQFKGMTELLFWGEQQLAQGRLDIPSFQQRLINLQSAMNQANPIGGSAPVQPQPTTPNKGVFNPQTGKIEFPNANY